MALHEYSAPAADSSPRVVTSGVLTRGQSVGLGANCSGAPTAVAGRPLGGIGCPSFSNASTEHGCDAEQSRTGRSRAGRISRKALPVPSALVTASPTAEPFGSPPAGGRIVV